MADEERLNERLAAEEELICQPSTASEGTTCAARALP